MTQTALASIALRDRHLQVDADGRLDSLSIAVEHAPNGIALLAADGSVSYANARLAELLGEDPEEQPLEAWMLEPEAMAGLRDALAHSSWWTTETRLAGSAGAPFWAALTVAPVPGHGTTRAVVQIENATARRQALEALETANDTLLRTNEARSTFVSIVSHELRTPLTAIRGAIELVAGGHSGPTSPEQDRFMQMALRNLTRLSSILDDLLDLSRIDAGRLSLTPGELEVAPLVSDVGHTFSAKAAQAGIELVVDVAAGLPALFADSARLHQVLANLVGNAVKFTPRGGRITISAKASSEAIEIAVTDSGLGIARDSLPRVFDRFWQAEDVLTRKSGGSGLGLSIARDLVEAHAGTLTVESELGKGSRFTVRLPIDSEATRETAELEERLVPHRRYPAFGVLVVEPLGSADELAIHALADALHALLPRTCDEIVVQPASGRVALLLGATDRSGADIVRRRLAQRLEGLAVVRGPGMYPDHGHTAGRLLAAATAN